jgi:hypothetical protein
VRGEMMIDLWPQASALGFFCGYKPITRPRPNFNRKGPASLTLGPLEV